MADLETSALDVVEHELGASTKARGALFQFFIDDGTTVISGSTYPRFMQSMRANLARHRWVHDEYDSLRNVAPTTSFNEMVFHIGRMSLTFSKMREILRKSASFYKRENTVEVSRTLSNEFNFHFQMAEHHMAVITEIEWQMCRALMASDGFMDGVIEQPLSSRIPERMMGTYVYSCLPTVEASLFKQVSKRANAQAEYGELTRIAASQVSVHESGTGCCMTYKVVSELEKQAILTLPGFLGVEIKLLDIKDNTLLHVLHAE